VEEDEFKVGFGGETLRNGPFERHTQSRDDNIKMDLKKIG
jgi:hypothetical protein